MKRTVLQNHRREVALTQQDVATACGVNISTVRRWEYGETDPQPQHRRLLSEIFGLEPSRLATMLDTNPIGLPTATSTTNTRESSDCDDEDPLAIDPACAALEWILTRDGPLHALAVTGPDRTRRVGADLLAQVASRIIRFRLADDVTATRLLFPEVIGEIERVEIILRRHSYTDETGRGLHGMLAELYQLAGCMAIDQGKIKRAERYYAIGAKAATVAGDDVLVAQLFSCNSYQQASRGKDALLLARAALHGAGEGLSPKVFALFQERIAWAAAQIGEATTSYRALGQVDEALNGAGNEPEPHFVYWLNRDEADVMAARCHLRLGDANRATALLRPAIDRYPEGHHREKALYLSWLAEAHIERGDRDVASTIIEEIEEFNVDSHRVSARLAAMT